MFRLTDREYLTTICLACSDIDMAIQEFNGRYPGAYPGKVPADEFFTLPPFAKKPEYRFLHEFLAERWRAISEAAKNLSPGFMYIWDGVIDWSGMERTIDNFIESHSGINVDILFELTEKEMPSFHYQVIRLMNSIAWE